MRNSILQPAERVTGFMIDALVPQVKERLGLLSHVMDIPIYCVYTSGGQQWCAHPFTE